MKDKEAREDIGNLRWDVNEFMDVLATHNNRIKTLEEANYSLTHVDIRECPKCEHPTIMRYIAPDGWDDEYYQCLNCGKKFVENTQTKLVDYEEE